MKFSFARVKGVKADVAAGVITISFTVPLIDLFMAEEVAKYCNEDAGKVAVEITAIQPGLFTTTLAPHASAGEEHEGEQEKA